MSERSQLHALAELAGITRAYAGYAGGERVAPDSTCEALLVALGIDASSEERARETRRALEARAAQSVLEPVRVVRAGAPDLAKVELRLPPEVRGNVAFELELTLEEGAKHKLAGEISAEQEALLLPMPAATELSFGYHALRCVLAHNGRDLCATQQLIVAPTSCVRLRELIGERRAVGIWGHLYSLHRQQSWGIGDFGDLQALLEWAGDAGLELCGINPLHALDVDAPEVSPYYPLSRLFRNPIYLDVAAAIERADSPEAQALIDPSRLAALRALPRVDYPRVLAEKRRVLQAAHRSFVMQHRGRSTALGRAYAAYRSREGEALRNFATFCALREHLCASDSRCSDFRAWPAHYRDPAGAEVTSFRVEQAEAVDFHAYLQFELEQQLGSCQAAARNCGMPIGLYGDLALGDAPFSADIWARPELYARGVNIGAPPDPYSDAGQSWGVLPFNPLALRADRYRAVSALLCRAFRHVGALRIDHVMGLQRQFWVPDGSPASMGAYVRFPYDDLAGILALESRRAGAVVIGEDLGVVPDGFRERMERDGLLRSQVLYFEHEWGGEPRPPRHYARAALASIGTHDLPPIPGFWAGQDLALRRRSGNLQTDDALAHALAERARAKQGLLALLRREGLLEPMPEEPPIGTLVQALCVLLASAESRLICLGLDDLTFEIDGLNTPATMVAGSPNWSRRSRLSLEQLAADARVTALLWRVTQRAREP
jgi:4-alpha-glucanotransferase